jgi:hypothetical protein
MQNVHLLCGQPTVAWIKRDAASLGGLYMGPSYFIILKKSDTDFHRLKQPAMSHYIKIFKIGLHPCSKNLIVGNFKYLKY